MEKGSLWLRVVWEDHSEGWVEEVGVPWARGQEWGYFRRGQGRGHAVGLSFPSEIVRSPAIHG